jgi:hypothetical protein
MDDFDNDDGDQFMADSIKEAEQEIAASKNGGKATDLTSQVK